MPSSSLESWTGRRGAESARAVVARPREPFVAQTRTGRRPWRGGKRDAALCCGPGGPEPQGARVYPRCCVFLFTVCVDSVWKSGCQAHAANRCFCRPRSCRAVLGISIRHGSMDLWGSRKIYSPAQRSCGRSPSRGSLVPSWRGSLPLGPLGRSPPWGWGLGLGLGDLLACPEGAGPL